MKAVFCALSRTRALNLSSILLQASQVLAVSAPSLFSCQKAKHEVEVDRQDPGGELEPEGEGTRRPPISWRLAQSQGAEEAGASGPCLLCLYLAGAPKPLGPPCCTLSACQTGGVRGERLEQWEWAGPCLWAEDQGVRDRQACGEGN
eukprot:scaffold125183_cov27-Tisochrysis_lutea.AAC.1